MDITIKNSWEDLTWNEYCQIEQILNTDIPEDYKTVHLISVLTGMSVDQIENLPITQVQRLIPALNFLHTEPETRTHQFEYAVNGRQYKFTGKLDEITTAQYIDYRSYMSKEERDVVELMSVFMIPVGHEYNDGYDIEQVKSDIGDMCWLDVRASSFFFRLYLSAYMLILKSSLEKTMKATKKGKSREQKRKIQQDIKQMQESLNNTAYYLLSSEYVNSATLNLIK